MIKRTEDFILWWYDELDESVPGTTLVVGLLAALVFLAALSLTALTFLLLTRSGWTGRVLWFTAVGFGAFVWYAVKDVIRREESRQ